MPFSTVLVANRGEIAVRVISGARALGYRTVAVYSRADAAAPHVRLADRAVEIGPAPARESYLDGARILAAARAAGADAVHPGYGFLSENAGFARACAEAGLVFIGPPPEAIALMGNKRQAKLRMERAGVPCVPGYSGPDGSDAALLAAAQRIGPPIMVKAAAGGGGRGMRRVADLAALPAALSAARAEAESAFGSGELILERALTRPRHVEIQVFADTQGNVLHLGERDCSVQRRHQKVLEEAPSPVLTPELRARMGEAAVRAAREIRYVGAGTVEFLLDEDGSFHFLEMNTRLQVEHPVTELVTGLDLVAWQFRVAAGEPLPLTQEQVRFSGHAIEARLYAEDPYAGFLPQSGRVAAWLPAGGPGVRVDHGLGSGGLAEPEEISPHYDPLVAKVIAHGATREEARRRLIRALEDSVLLGPPNNRAFLVALLSHPDFAAGRATTAFIEERFGPGLERPAPPPALVALAALLPFAAASGGKWQTRPQGGEAVLAWQGGMARTAVTGLPAGDFSVTLGAGTPEAATYAMALLERVEALPGVERLRYACDGVQATAHAARIGEDTYLQCGGSAETFREVPQGVAAARPEAAPGRRLAPMTGRIVAVRARVGEAVVKGQCLVVLEAMKMQHEFPAPADGVVIALPVAVGDQVAARQLLFELGPSAAGAGKAP
jgi:geranyl-CoA carboxylase alpha subunit